MFEAGTATVVLAATVALTVPAPTAAARRVIYGINDANFQRAELWPQMRRRLQPLGKVQLGLWVRYRCKHDRDEWLVRGLPDDLGPVPRTQPVMVQFVGASTCAPRTTRSRRAYALAARALVERYPNIRELQVWNEPDLDFWQLPMIDYVRLLAATHDALSGSGVKVLGPGFSPNRILLNVTRFASAVREFYWLQPYRRTQILGGFAYHPYWGFDNKTTALIARTLNTSWNDVPQPSPKRGLRFWWTETGAESLENAAPAMEFGSGNGYCGNQALLPAWQHMMGDEAFQANRVATVALKARANPLVVADFNFQLADDPNLERWQSGLFRVGGLPKPAFWFFRDAIRIVRGLPI